jgi:hypothetical protein
MKQQWLLYVLLAGLSWGTYVPIIFYGGSELGYPGKPVPPASRILAILCVGMAYFVMAVVVPTILFVSGQQKWSDVNLTKNGLVFSSLAGVAGAVGAICVVFASKAAMDAGRAVQADDPTFNPATFRMYIAPLIFGLAPVINTIVSLVWHPKPGNWLSFHFEMPGWKLILGIVLVAVGAGLVLFSKEQAEAAKSPPKPVAPKPTDSPAEAPK